MKLIKSHILVPIAFIVGVSLNYSSDSNHLNRTEPANPKKVNAFEDLHKSDSDYLVNWPEFKQFLSSPQKESFVQFLNSTSKEQYLDAQKHLKRTRESKAFEGDINKQEFLDYLDTITKQQSQVIPGVTFVSTTGPNSQSRDTLEKLGRRVIESRAKIKPGGGEILEHISYNAWRMLFAEYATLHPEMGQFSNARWAFEGASAEIVNLRQRLMDNADLYQALAKTEDGRFAITQLDTIYVRQEAIAKRMKLNLQQERRRTIQLQDLLKTYRGFTEKLVLATTYQNAGNSQRAITYLSEVMTDVTKLRELLKPDAIISEQNPTVRDYYLLFNEVPLDTTESPTDFEIINLSSTIFSESIVGHLKSLASLAIFSESFHAESLETRLQQLSKAESYALAARSDNANLNELPMGADSESIFAEFVATLIAVEKGTISIASNLADQNIRIAQKGHFDAAKESIAFLRKNEQINELPIIQEQINILDQKIQNTEYALQTARNELQGGNLQSASAVLGEALTIHSSDELWATWLDTHRRINSTELKQKTDLFLRAISNGLIPADTLLVSRSRALAAITYFTNQYAQAVNANGVVSTDDVTFLQTELAQLENLLPQYENDKVEWSQLQACRNSMVFLLDLASGANAAELKRLTDLYSAGLIAVKELQTAVTANPTSLIHKECLIVLLRSQGYLGTKILDDYQDDAVAHYLYAYDLESSLPFTVSPAAQHGTPLLTLLRNRDKNSESQLAFEERRTRHLIAGFLDAAYLTTFGSPQSAKESADKALIRFADSSANGKDASNYRAQDYNDTVDGFDKKVSLLDTAKCYQVLATIAASQPREALVKALMIIGVMEPLEEVPNESIVSAMQSTSSPLVVFTLGTSLESYALTLDDSDAVKRNLHLKQALGFFERGIQLLKSELLQSRYPYLQESFEAGVNRLNSEDRAMDKYLASASGISMKELRDDLKRYPNSVALWATYLEIRLAQVLASGNSDELLVLEETIMENKGLMPPFIYFTYRGKVLEANGMLEEAIASYRSGLEQARDLEEKAIINTYIGNGLRKFSLGN